MKIKTNLVSGIFFMIVGVVLLLLMPSQVIVNANIPFLESAKVAPFMALMIMIIGGAFLVIQSMVFKKDVIYEVDALTLRYAGMVMGFLAGYALMIYLTGFLIGSLALCVTMFKFFKVKNKKHLVIVLVIAVVVYYIFIYLFHISLPGIGGVFVQ